jgi:hypothetical protein
MDNAKHYDDAAIALIESRCKSNTHRIDELQEHQSALDRLVTSVEVLATKQETVEGDVKEIKEDVKTITGKAGKRWDSLVDKALAALAGVAAEWGGRMKRLIKKASKLRTRNIILIIVGIFIAAFVIYTVIFYSIKGWQWDNIFPYLLGTGGIIEAFTGLLTLVEIIVGKRKEKKNEI